MNEPWTPPVLTNLTGLEQEVVDAARRGDWVKRRGGTVEAADTDSPYQRVRAGVIRDLLLGRHGELDPHGILLEGVRVVGELDLDNVQAVTCLILRKCALPDGITCRSARLHDLILNGCHMPFLHADGLHIDGALSLQDAVVRGGGELGAVRLNGAHIGGPLDLHRAVIVNDAGPALHADRLRTDGHLLMQDATVCGSGELGTVRLSSARIGDQLDLSGTEIVNDTGPGLHADSLHTDSALFLRNAVVRGNGELGAVRLHSAHIGNQLDLSGTEIVNDTGPGLNADRLHTDGHLLLRDTTVHGNNEKGAVWLLGARIDGQASLNVARVTNQSGPLLVLSEAHVQNTLLLPATVVCPESSEETGRQGCKHGDQQIEVNGLVFGSLTNVSWRKWLHLLTHHIPGYSPQPFQQLAAVERAGGHENHARKILITQQDTLHRRVPQALGGRVARWRHRLWGWLGGYGYRALRLISALALVLAVAAALGYIAGQVSTRPGHHAAERVQPLTAPADAPGVPCSTVELIGLGIDRGLPLGATGLRVRCDLDTGTRRGQAFTIAIWGLQAMVWALATLAIAAYTGLVRKPA